ncbi:holo-ACP synthase [Ornithinibacillus sp. L9]|uniref:Holo-[acyl-carrier-protein] synthase n=1 Tax=Ornithinibacillus caprae TaxID=2678566 RepID=A0A6N8FJD2_9BACI|nr:holo-ACP synthase [Ornithinibacillus caprae]MUK89720.1 holo-ACP synthase [Ornithinibacillus caprae]
MIKGIGIDIIELIRIKESIQKNNRFADRILTNREKEYFMTLNSESRKVEFLAGRFAGKEAFAKATGTGIGRLSFADIEILPNEQGAPTITVSGYDAEQIFISISHSKEYVVAQVIIED